MLAFSLSPTHLMMYTSASRTLSRRSSVISPLDSMRECDGDSGMPECSAAAAMDALAPKRREMAWLSSGCDEPLNSLQLKLPDAGMAAARVEGRRRSVVRRLWAGERRQSTDRVLRRPLSCRPPQATLARAEVAAQSSRRTLPASVRAVRVVHAKQAFRILYAARDALQWGARHAEVMLSQDEQQPGEQREQPDCSFGDWDSGRAIHDARGPGDLPSESSTYSTHPLLWLRPDAAVHPFGCGQTLSEAR